MNWRCEICGKFQLSGDGNICKCVEPKWVKPKSVNHHPTVKPLKLMSYLVTLGSRPGDIILDPFMGSGTTALAAKMLNRQFIGFELSEEYCKIAEARLAAVSQQRMLVEAESCGIGGRGAQPPLKQEIRIEEREKQMTLAEQIVGE